MEPMTLGSPTGSPSPANNSFLPSYLIGESNLPTTPRNNTLSPTKGRTLAFGQTTRGTPSTPAPPLGFSEINRQRSVFGNLQSPTSPGLGQSVNFSSVAPSTINPNQSVSGPPTQDLFDALDAERSFVEHPSFAQNPTIRSLANGGQFNQSVQFNQSFNDSYLNASGFNSTRLTTTATGGGSGGGGGGTAQSTAIGGQQQKDFDYSAMNPSTSFADCMSPRQANFWVTIYGFPQTSTSAILAHFSQCGTIVDKIFPPQTSNWMHIKFASRLECDRALNFHERIICNNLMIGATYCKDPAVVDKENIERNTVPVNRVRPLVHSPYQSAKVSTEVVVSPTVPKRNTGLVDKALDMLFGW